MPRLKEIYRILNNIAPFSLQENWDNSGILAGDEESEINTVLITLELTRPVFEEAKEKSVDLIITHHPAIFSAVKKITRGNNNLLYDLIKSGISLISMHTNFDIKFRKDFIPSFFKESSSNIKEFAITGFESLKKIVVYVPDSHADNVRKAMFDSGAGNIGNYSDCSFNLKGNGTFKAGDNTKPFIGKKDIMEFVEETRIETVCSENNLNKILNEMKKAHPYEEVAYDIYDLNIKGDKWGYGSIINLKDEMVLKDIGVNLKSEFKMLRISGNPNKKVKKIAFCNGSGASFIKKAIKNRVDLYVTGDLKYHDAVDAYKEGLCMIDLGHYETEKVFVNILHNNIKNNSLFKEIKIIKSEKDSPVFWGI